MFVVLPFVSALVHLPHVEIFVNVNAYIIVNKNSKTNECAKESALLIRLQRIAFWGIAHGAFAACRDFR